MPFDPVRLKSALLNTGLQVKDNALWQVINLLIDALGRISLEVHGSAGGGGGITPIDPTIDNNNIRELANSRLGYVQSFNDEVNQEQPYIIPGPPGSRGLRGLTGDHGSDGIDGIDGIDGFPGINGIQGATGARGVDGLPGPPGLDGFLDEINEFQLFLQQSSSGGGDVFKAGTNAFTGANSFANTVVDLLVGQLKFPATQNASSDANTLDDYEEGTWTPTDTSGAALAFTLGTNQYIKIGQLVIVCADVTYPVTASGANAQIGGLPFTSQNLASGAATWGCFITFSSVGAGVLMRIVVNATTINIGDFAGAAKTNVSLSTLVLRFVGVYRASA